MTSQITSRYTPEEATSELWNVAVTDDITRLEHLLACGADVNARNEDGVTALMRASATGQLEIATVLIESGAHIDVQRADGFTPLMLASFFGHADVVKMLVGRGADLNATNKFGTSAEMWATTRSFHDIAEYLQSARNGTPEVEPDADNPEEAWAAALYAPNMTEEVVPELEAAESEAVQEELETDSIAEPPEETFYAYEDDLLPQANSFEAAEESIEIPNQVTPEKTSSHEDDLAPQATSFETVQESVEIPNQARPKKTFDAYEYDFGPETTFEDAEESSDIPEQRLESPAVNLAHEESLEEPPPKPTPRRVIGDPPDIWDLVPPNSFQPHADKPKPPVSNLKHEELLAEGRHGSSRLIGEPPEIWDLVNPNQVEFKPGFAFVTRITSSWTNLGLLIVVLGLVTAGGTFTLLKWKDGKSIWGDPPVAKKQSYPDAPRPKPVESKSAVVAPQPQPTPVVTPVATASETQVEAPSTVAAQPLVATASASYSPARETRVPPSSNQIKVESKPVVVSPDSVVAKESRSPDPAPQKSAPVETKQKVPAGSNAAREVKETSAAAPKVKPQPQVAEPEGAKVAANETQAPRTVETPPVTPPAAAAPPPSRTPAPKAKVIQWP